MEAIDELTKGLDGATELRGLLDAISSPLCNLCDEVIATLQNGISLLKTLDNETPFLSSSKQNINKVTITTSPFSDGYKWRKYGKKTIGNSIYQRSYYRFNSDKCNGKIQVRQVNCKESPEYEVISTNEHTCDIVQHNPLLPPRNVEELDRSRLERALGNEVASSPEPMTDQPPEIADLDFSWDEQALNELMSIVD